MLQGYDVNNYNQFIHFMKAKNFYSIFKFYIKNNGAWAPFYHNGSIDYDEYYSEYSIERLIVFLEKFCICNQLLNSNRYYIDQLTVSIGKLKNPESLRSYDNFEIVLAEIGEYVKTLDSELHKKILKISCEECDRLDEALVDYSNHCLKSSVIMAISAVELRLHKMIKKKDNQRYVKKFENATLGQIIYQFSDNGEFLDIRKLLPKKHFPLIQLLNQYRIFAVHPKNEKITPTIVDSILTLSFTFITDPEISVYTDEELSCGTEKAKKTRPTKKIMAKIQK